MPNLTPPQYRVHYEIYPNKACIRETAGGCHGCTGGAHPQPRPHRSARGRGDSPSYLHPPTVPLPERRAMSDHASTRRNSAAAATTSSTSRSCRGCWSRRPSPGRLRDVIAKSMAKEPLASRRRPCCWPPTTRRACEQIFDAARQLKRDVYGNRIVLFAPLYVGNECTNDCHVLRLPPLEPRGGPPHAQRRRTSAPRSRPWSAAATSGLILVFGEHPRYTPEFMADCVRQVYAVQARRAARSAG